MEEQSWGREVMEEVRRRMSSSRLGRDDLAVSRIGLRASAKRGLREVVLEERLKEREVIVEIVS